MASRSKGKKALANSDAVVVDANGVDTAGVEGGGSNSAGGKKRRGRLAKKDTQAVPEEANDVAPPEFNDQIKQKPSKGAKKASKNKDEVEEEAASDLPKDDEGLSDEAASADLSPAPIEKKSSNRKRKAENNEKAEEAVLDGKKPSRTKTKAARKATDDQLLLPVPSQNGNKKGAQGKKRQIEKADENDSENEAELETAPPATKNRKGSKKEVKKTATKTKGKKDEEVPEDDVLPEEEFTPEDDEVEKSKIKKIVKSKGSRKQLKDDIPPPPIEKEDEEEESNEQRDSPIEDTKKVTGRRGKKPATAAVKPVATKSPPKKRGRGKKGAKAAEELADDEVAADNNLPESITEGVVDLKKTAGRGRKRASTKPDETDGAKHATLNPTATIYNADEFSFTEDFTLKISSWNVAGLRSWIKKDGLQYVQYEKPDIICLQETKCITDQLPEQARIPGYHPYWLCMPGGHAGVAIYSKIMPINVEYGIGHPEHDSSGRLITAEYEKFYLLCVYVQNSGRGLDNLEKRLQWEKLFREYIQRLDKVKPVIIAGDMNVSHKEIDLANPKTNTKNAGFTPQEREAMTQLLDLGYVDTFRHFHSDQKGAYTFWSYLRQARSKNIGWRLDYFIVSEKLLSKVVESTIRSQVLGSDHCPITMFLNV